MALPKADVLAALAVAAALFFLLRPFLLSAAGPDFDLSILHSLGNVSTGFAGACQRLWSLPWEFLPSGTPVFRLSCSSVCAASIACALFYLVGVSPIDRAQRGFRARFSLLIAILAVALSPAFFLASTGPGPAPFQLLLSGVLVLVASWDRRFPMLLGALAALLASEAPALGIPVAMACLFFWRPKRADAPRLALGVALGCLPFLAHQLCPKIPGLAAVEAVQIHPWFTLRAMAAETGIVIALLALGGMFRWFSFSRRHFGLLLAVGAAGLLGAAVEGNAADGAGFLLAMMIAALFAAHGLMGCVEGVSRLPVPFAAASSWMIVLLAAAIPAAHFEEANRCATSRKLLEEVDWAHAAFHALPERTLFIFDAPHLRRHLLAARAAGVLAPDFEWMDLSAPTMSGLSLSGAADPDTTHLVRDVVLTGLPSEAALTRIADKRPLALLYDPRWEVAIARHLVPAGAVDLFLPEPRAPNERKKALEEWSGEFASLYSRTKASEPHRRLVFSLVRSRTQALLAAQDHENLPRAALDAIAFSPNGPEQDSLTAMLFRPMRAPTAQRR